MWIVVSSFLLHLISIGFIYEIYFKNSIVHVPFQYKPSLSPQSKRVVIFAADGISAETLFGIHPGGYDGELPNINESITMFFKQLIFSKAGWGVSHVPISSLTNPNPGTNLINLVGFCILNVQAPNFRFN